MSTQHSRSIIDLEIESSFESGSNVVFLYKFLSGDTARFLGDGDLHDPRFEHLKLSAGYSSFVSGSSSGENVDYTGVEIDDQLISYSIRVYPSAELEDDYLTRTPFIYMCAMLSVFLFCLILFL